MKNTIRIILVAGLLIFTFRPSAAMGQFFFQENEGVGKPVQDFNLKTVGGEKVSLSSFLNGSRAIIFFWATWCPHCRRELNDLNKNREVMVQKGIKIVLVDIGETEAVVQQYVQKNNIHMPIFLDVDSSTAESYGLVGVPTFYFVDDKGVVRDVQHSLPEDYEEIFSASQG